MKRTRATETERRTAQLVVLGIIALFVISSAYALTMTVSGGTGITQVTRAGAHTRISPAAYGVPTQMDIAYGPGARQKLDWYNFRDVNPSPAFAGNRPTIVYFHGGGFTGGTKTWTPLPPGMDLKQKFQENGYHFVSVEYTLAPRVEFPVPENEAKMAIQFLKAHANEYTIDPNRIITIGTSAGAVLAGFAAYDPSVGVKAYVNVAGQTNWELVDGSMTVTAPHFGETSFATIPLSEKQAGSLTYLLQSGSTPVPTFSTYVNTSDGTIPTTDIHDYVFGAELQTALTNAGMVDPSKNVFMPNRATVDEIYAWVHANS